MASVRARLSVMMFLEYFVWGAWYVTIGGYMKTTLGFSQVQMGWIYSTVPLAAIISPLFVGFVADRYFATEKILAVLHLVGGVLLCISAQVFQLSSGAQFPVLMTLMMLNTLCYMPTLALTNSIAFENITDSEKDFPIIRVWGSFGWIVAGLMIGVLLGQTKQWFLDLAGLSGILMGLYCLTLPHTPPKGAAKTGKSLFGLDALKLLKEPSFAVFVIAAFLICIPLSFYFALGNQFLVETDRPAPTALQTLGQISELFFMAAMPFFMMRFGIKDVFLLGMLAWAARFLCFASLSFPLVLIGLLLHGACYAFCFVAPFIYVDQKAPRDLRASAQSFIAFVTFGLGMLVGTQLAGLTAGAYVSPITITATDAKGEVIEKAALPNWEDTERDKTAWRYLDLSSTINAWLHPESKKEAVVDLAQQVDKNKDGEISREEIGKLPAKGVTVGDLTYSRKDLLTVFDKVDLKGAGVITRPEWREAQALRWPSVWSWPALLAVATGMFFLLGFTAKAIPEPAKSEDKAG
ncbi:MAG: MFS transporter [Pirellulales bacterium]